MKRDEASPPKKRYCLTLDLKEDAGLIRQYREWHQSDRIWPEIPRGIREVGILDMEIYILGRRLFMVMETEADFDFERQMSRLATLPRQGEWEAFVARFQEVRAGAESGEKWKLMERIFTLP